jgi:hypothetical protein
MSQQKISEDDAEECRPLSAEDSHASLILLQENVKVLVMSVTSGRTSGESFAKLGPDGSWQKTSQGSVQQKMDGSTEEFCETWPEWGIVSAGVAGKLPISALPNIENGYLLWPTPTPSQGIKPARTLCPSEENGSHGIMLNAAIGDSMQKTPLKMWPTPKSHEAGDYQRDRGRKGKERPTLQGAVRMFPTPKSRDWKGQSQRGIHGQMDALPNIDKGDGTPIGGLLNPDWEEWLMGYQTGWTALLPSEMPSSRSKSTRSSKRSRILKED